jgi:hypothetical protein
MRKVIANGPLAAARFGWTFAPHPGAPFPADTGEAVAVLWRDADGWRIVEEMWRSDLPVAATLPAPAGRSRR